MLAWRVEACHSGSESSLSLFLLSSVKLHRRPNQAKVSLLGGFPTGSTRRSRAAFWRDAVDRHVRFHCSLHPD